MKEICICSAVKTEDGLIIRGHRHCDCLYKIYMMEKKPMKTHESQGFITSTNRFVDRVEGLRLQKEAGVESADPSGYGRELYSEDLY